ncbi:MAG: EpsG family protein [Cloacibacterium sp.]|nr:EpsG family protein [Cloacibacterium sp.]
MEFLHPIFTFVFIFLMVASFAEVYYLNQKKPIFVWITWFFLLIAAGFRYFVGADYPIYNNLFVGFSIYTSYADVWDKALFRESAEQIEWIFVLINKIVFDLGLPFYMVTFIMALITLSLKFSTIYENVSYPALAILLYFMPIFFFEDSGQMRQGIGIAISVFSFRYIKSRNLPMFLLMIYLALGFHKTSVVFLPAYWIVKIPMNSERIFIAIVVSILLSPLELFSFAGGLVESITPQDISGGFTGYINDEQLGGNLDFGLNDIVKVLYIVLMIVYDKEACKKVYYYEYMRNLAVFGLCLFYMMRGNSIFAIRLPGAYMFFLTMFVIPSIVFAVRDSVKKIIHLGLMTYLVLMYFYFAKTSGSRGGFGYNRYNNFLWMK